jgi:hypothetical protein
MKMKKPIHSAPGAVGTPPKPAIPPEILASAIVRISKAFDELSGDSGLNRKAIIVLLQDATKLPKRDIEFILNALQDLKRQYCR